MSNTRKAQPGTAFRQERYCSSPEFERGVMANLVAKRCSVLADKKQREIVWFLQLLSWMEGGLERVARDLVEANPKNLRRISKVDADEFGVDCDSGKFAVAELPNHLREMCLNPQTSVDRPPPWYFAELFASLVQYQQSFVAAAQDNVVTTLGQKVYDALEYALETRRLVVIEGLERTGKTVAAKAWCAANPGRARYVQIPSTRDDAGLFRAIALGIGLSVPNKIKTLELRTRIEDTLQSSDLLLVLDEAHYLWPQREFRTRTSPDRINWLMTALVNHGVPVALVTTPQFARIQAACEEMTLWRSGQFLGRIGHFEVLPESLTPEDLANVARFLVPEASDKSIDAMVSYAEGSMKYLAAIDAVVCRARYLASRENRETISLADIKRAISESVIPSDSALAKTFSAGKRGRNPAAMHLQPQRTTEPATPRDELPANRAPRGVTPLAAV